jgi:hypothetical protein
MAITNRNLWGPDRVIVLRPDGVIAPSNVGEWLSCDQFVHNVHGRGLQVRCEYCRELRDGEAKECEGCGAKL